MPPHPLTNFDIQKYYENEPRFNGVYSRYNLPRRNKGWGIRNKPWWICRCGHTLDCFICNRSEIVYFDNFDFEHVPEEIKEFAWNKNIIAHIFWVQANNSVMCGYFCTGFIDFMLAGKNDFTDWFYEHVFSLCLLKKITI